ncbi:unnamed protein product [Rhizopus stolonifer]
MKEMTTTDKSPSDSQNEDETMTVTEEKKEIVEKDTDKPMKQFGGKGDDDDWGEFAEEEEEVSTDAKKKDEDTSEKPKYTFGSSSGFGTKGWGAVHQTMPAPPKVNQPTFGGFSSFGLDKLKPTTDGKDQKPSEAKETQSTPAVPTSTPSFASFAKATVSPFAAAAAAATSGNSLKDTSSFSTSAVSNDAVEKPKSSNDQDESHNFGEEAKVKVPGVKPTNVKTGEEDENTIYQTKAKLLILDGNTGNWKERGVGTFRINTKDEENKSTPQARLVMRADSVYKLILNLLLFPGMKVFIMQEKFVRFAGFEKISNEDGADETKLVNFALKLSNSFAAQEVYETISAHLPASTKEN